MYVLYVDLWDSGVKCVYKFNLLVGWLNEHLIKKWSLVMAFGKSGHQVGWIRSTGGWSALTAESKKSEKSPSGEKPVTWDIFSYWHDAQTQALPSHQKNIQIMAKWNLLKVYHLWRTEFCCLSRVVSFPQGCQSNCKYMWTFTKMV